MKYCFVITLFISICTFSTIKAQGKSLIFENDSIAIYDTYISLNSKENISPTIYKNGILYSSGNKLGFYKLYFSDLENVPQKIKIDSKFHVGLVAMFKNEIYFTKNIKGLKTAISDVYDLAIFKGNLENNKVSKAEPLSIYKKGFSYGHPAISKNGDQMVIITNEKGFYHLLELKRDSNNEWQRSEVIFIAQTGFKIINPTIYDENTIYFSSNAHQGKVRSVEYAIENEKPVISNVIYEEGVFNIYKIKRVDGKWALPQKVTVFNSEFDDLSVIFKTENTGFLNTFRYDNTDNIYYFELKY